MSYYDEHSPIGFFDDDDDIEAAVGGSQLQSDDDDAFDALNGDYDDILNVDNDNLAEMMDAEEDMEDLEDAPEDDELAAAEIVEQSTGTLSDGSPKAAITVSLDMINPDTYQKQGVATQAMYQPILEFHKRMEFIEIVFTFPTAIDNNLRVLYNHLETFGRKLDEISPTDQFIPLMAITIVPISSLGSCYMVANQPVFWALQSQTFGGPLNQLKIAVPGANVNFYQTDETDLTEIISAVQREREAEDEFYAQAQAKEDALYDDENDDFNLRDFFDDNEDDDETEE